MFKDCHCIDETYLVTKSQTRKKFRKSILEAWSYRCAYCGEDIKNSATLDHVVARSKGGETAKHNLVACCPHCNVSKSDKSAWLWYRQQAFYDIKKEIAIASWFYGDIIMSVLGEHFNEIPAVI